MRTSGLLVSLVFTALNGSAQNGEISQKFEVASVKAVPHETGQPYGPEKITANPGSLIMKNVRLRACIKWAYDVRDYEISGPDWLGSPGWMAVERYDVIAKAPDGTPITQLRLMLRALLAERFRLAIHRESKELPAYALVVGKGGPHLHTSDAEGESSLDAKGDVLSLRKTTMAEFAGFLAGPLHAPVLDGTSLKGRFDFSLNVPPAASRDDQEYAFLTAMQNQLGLKLDRQKSQLEILVVDHVERVPTEN